MSKHRKSWSSSQKLEIINYANQHGIPKAVREYSVSTTSIYEWQNRYEKEGETGLHRSRKSSGVTVELRELRRENQQLKELVAEKELALRIKDALLKKSK